MNGGLQSLGNKNNCIVKPYDELKCESGYQKHHIVPDYTLRVASRAVGTRADGFESMPLSKGPCICLEGGSKTKGSAHCDAHSRQDPRIEAAGSIAKTIGDKTYPAGTAPLSEVKEISIKEVGDVSGCEKEIRKEVEKAFDGIDGSTPCRTTQEIPDGEALKRLSKAKNTAGKIGRKF